MRSSMVVVREPGQQMAPEFKQKALEEFPTVLGYACPMGTHVETDIFVSDEHNLKEMLDLIEDEYKDDRVFYTFIRADDLEKEFHFDSCQPFELVHDGEGDAKKAVLVAMTDGDFPNFADEDDPNTNDKRFIDSHLLPKLGELLELADGKIEGMVPYFDKKPTKEHIASALNPRGAVFLIPAERGKASLYNKEIKPGSWQWGYATRDLGIPSATAEAKPEEKPKLSLRARSSVPATPAEQPNEQEEKPVEKKQGDSPDVEHPRVAALLQRDERFYLNKGELWVRPPKDGKWKGAREFWNNQCSDPRPKDTEPAEIYIGFPFSRLKPDASLRIFYNNLMSAPDEKLKPKEAESVQGPAEPKDETPTENKVLSLLINATAVQKFRSLVKNKSFETQDDATLNKTLADWPVASVQLGEDYDKFLRASPLDLIRIGHTIGVHGCVVLIHEMRCRELGLYTGPKKDLETKHIPAPETAAKPRLSLRARAAA